VYGSGAVGSTVQHPSGRSGDAEEYADAVPEMKYSSCTYPTAVTSKPGGVMTAAPLPVWIGPSTVTSPTVLGSAGVGVIGPHDGSVVVVVVSVVLVVGLTLVGVVVSAATGAVIGGSVFSGWLDCESSDPDEHAASSATVPTTRPTLALRRILM